MTESYSSSEEEEGEIIPEIVTNYHFVNSQNKLISISDLPLYDHNDNVIAAAGDDSPVAFLLGNTDGGLQSFYKEVIGWKYELSFVSPQFYALLKKKVWIQIDKPRKSYEFIVTSVFVVIRFLHYVKRNVEATFDEVFSHLLKVFSSSDLVVPLEKYLSSQSQLVRSAVANDKDLAKSKYLETFLMEIDNPGRRETLHEHEQMTNKSQFIISDDDVDIDEDDEEPEALFDSVCAFCDNGGEVLVCEGQCMRSFHPTIDAGVETLCESLGFKNSAQYEAIPVFLCKNCKHHIHQCFVCGMLGSSDKSSTAVEVFPCVSATCGHFYHPECVAKLLYPSDETKAENVKSQIAAGESFTCPIHKCHRCGGGEDKDDHNLQFAVCRRCPKAYHRQCLPKSIAFNGSDDGTIQQRAWDDLLPKRILIYCMKHAIIPSIWTPKRDHVVFPCIRKKNQGTTIDIMSERRSNALGILKESDIIVKMPKVVERQYNTDICANTSLEKAKPPVVHPKGSSLEDRRSISRNLEQPSKPMKKIAVSMPPKDSRSISRNLGQPSKPVKKIAVSTPPKVDADMKTRILRLVKDSTSSFDSEKFIKEKKRKCNSEIYSSQTGLDKTITMGKVEASVKAVRAALRILEDGGSVEDAKAVCEPNVLNQLIRWKNKLRVFLAPFLHGSRYTSFGRHFTKVDKLREIVDRLHWYVEDGDTIVDFCCGSNDFSCFMKEKLDSMGKRCRFKNYDLITPKNTLGFKKQDWFSVPVEALPDGSRLVMGLNPPFGVRASLANKFINHALKFQPKLIILIVPKETKRLDRKRYPYDLIWEEENMLSGKSFYLPGSVDSNDQPLDDWNVTPPPLSLWSHPDWTTKHRAVAEKHSHVEQKLHEVSERVVSNYLMEEDHDCFGDFSSIMSGQDMSTILDDVPEEPDDSEPKAVDPSTINPQDTNVTPDTSTGMVDMDLSSPVISSTNSRAKPIIPNPRFFQPTHSEQYLNYGPQPLSPPPQLYEHSSVSCGPAMEYRYTFSGQTQASLPCYYEGANIYPGATNIYDQGDLRMTSMHLPYADYGHSWPSGFGIPDHDYTSEPDIWPPGTSPSDHRYY
uniref:protein ENHANCED DOWNY MILDEW 2-like n=1 Tax=Erigeron canadensis TaxID=72917 RepID=UPI001CB93E70|nr:protein ENHANCED DOWNY MILDEW 2-like [Erigeron canadensis]